MRDYEWRLTYPGCDFVWGWPWGEVINLTAPDLGVPELRVDDADQPRQDGRLFGVDNRSGLTITFEIGLSTRAGEVAARDLAGQLRRAWRAEPVRRVGGAVAALTARHAGRERVTYGRPRRCGTVDQLARQGYIAAVCDFSTVDDCWYGTSVQQVTATLAPGLGGGMLAPLAGPLTSTSESDRSVAVTVGGELDAWPVITIRGPVTNPVVELVGLWRYELRTTLAYDQTAVIDTRPWGLMVRRSGGGSLAGAASPRSPRLVDMGIPPGTYEVGFRGVDETGTARASIAWQETYAGL